MKNTIALLASIFYLLVSTTSVFAVSTPSFPACANPQGSLKVSYSEGVHGIVGSGATYTGKDTVYTLSDSTTAQCFCGADGNGIQTNWWKASSLTESEINILKADGWHYVPTGSLWGLAVDPYLAKNIAYSCNSSSSSSGSVQGSSTTQDLDTGTGGGEVLGLAATGDSALVYGSFLLGTLLLIVGLRRLKLS